MSPWPPLAGDDPVIGLHALSPRQIELPVDQGAAPCRRCNQADDTLRPLILTRRPRTMGNTAGFAIPRAAKKISERFNLIGLDIDDETVGALRGRLVCQAASRSPRISVSVSSAMRPMPKATIWMTPA